MANIGLCAKVCWFIAQIVLLQLAHHHQSANAASVLEVHIIPPQFKYAVEVTTDDGRKITEGLQKTLFVDVNELSFTIFRADGTTNAVAKLSGKDARKKDVCEFDYYICGGD
uniref:Uncharacterized protein n=1 Tax=Globodera rostochiensis TaxID=31243 RepID=A0A914HKJ6_GLORO